MAGILYIVGTPIGNLKDITLRALDVLRAADIIACEDTRVSLKLLTAYEIKKPLISYYKQKERENTEKLLLALNDGKNVALITDAGMPCISDPGAVLVAECRKAGIKTEVVPGPSAVVSAMALSGASASGFIFIGFLAEKTKEKKEQIKDFLYSPLPLVFYSSPHNINEDGRFLFEQLGDREIYVVKELTKMFESVDRQRLDGFCVAEPRGEYVLIVMPSDTGNQLNDLTVKQQVQHYMQSGLTKKDAIKRTASDRKMDKNSVYSEVLDL